MTRARGPRHGRITDYFAQDAGKMGLREIRLIEAMHRGDNGREIAKL
jgi:hypothetical protein